MSAAPARRRILLALREERVDPRLLASAQGLCQRLEAELEILAGALAGERSDPLVPLRDRLREQGLVCHLTRLPRLRRRDVVAYANAHACIATLVLDSLEGWESVAEERGANPWRDLACPLVTAVPGSARRA